MKQMPIGLLHESHTHQREVTTFLFSLTLALTLVLILLRLPLYSRPGAVGWQVIPHPAGIEDAFEQLHFGGTMIAIPTDAGTRILAGVGPRSGSGNDRNAFAAGPGSQEQSEYSSRFVDLGSKLTAQEAALDYAEQMPDIVGGVGAFYINIIYPEEAARQGIEGRLLLQFTVETDGRPTNIQVLKPLHPLCDSAAVRALRETSFIPGKQNGVRVRVNMRLPVRFQLIDNPIRQARPSAIERRPYQIESQQ